MREIFEIINEYPWTTFFVWVMITLTVAVYAETKNNKP